MTKKIRIVTDSATDVPFAIRQQYGMALIPTYVNYGGGSYADDDHELERSSFYQQLPDMKVFPTTSAPSVGVAQAILEEALEGVDHLICVHIAEELSTTINSVRLAAANLPADRVTVIDTRSVSLGAGIQVIKAAQIAEQTGDVDQAVQAATRARENHELYVAVATMEYLKRSGRVTTLMASVGSLLQIKPVIRVRDGAVLPHQRVRTFTKALSQLRALTEAEGPLDMLWILHVGNEEGAQAFRDALGDMAPPDTQIYGIGPSVGTHLGIGAIGVVTLRANWQA